MHIHNYIVLRLNYSFCFVNCFSFIYYEKAREKKHTHTILNVNLIDTLRIQKKNYLRSFNEFEIRNYYFICTPADFIWIQGNLFSLVLAKFRIAWLFSSQVTFSMCIKDDIIYMENGICYIYIFTVNSEKRELLKEDIYWVE